MDPNNCFQLYSLYYAKFASIIDAQMAKCENYSPENQIMKQLITQFDQVKVEKSPYTLEPF